MIDEQSSASGHDYASDRSAIVRVAKGYRSCYVELPRFSDRRPSPGVCGGSSDLAMLEDRLFLVCWSLTSLCHSNGHIETIPAR